MALWKKDSGCYKTSYRRTREKWHYAKPYEGGSFHFLFIRSSFLESSYHDVRKHNQHAEWSIWRRANAHGTESWLSASQEPTPNCHSCTWAIWKSKSYSPLLPPVWGVRKGFLESLLLKGEQELRANASGRKGAYSYDLSASHNILTGQLTGVYGNLMTNT